MNRDRLTAKEYRESLNKPKRKATAKAKNPKLPTSGANAITTAAVNWLCLNGFKAWRTNNGAVWDPKKQCFRKNKNKLLGIPDINGFEKGTGRALYIEVKAGKDKLSPEQIQFLEEAERGGAITGVIRESIEIESIIHKYKLAA